MDPERERIMSSLLLQLEACLPQICLRWGLVAIKMGMITGNALELLV